MTEHHWQPIEDLPEGWEALRDEPLHRLGERWARRLARLRELGKEAEFHEAFRVPLARRWAVETGLVEGLYYVDRGTTEALIAEGIRAEVAARGITGADPEDAVPIMLDAEEVLEGLFGFVKQDRPLSTSYVRELHQALMRNQPTTKAADGMGRRVEIAVSAGEWKRLPNNPSREGEVVHLYCPPEHVAAEMDRLIEMHLAHVEAGVPAEVEAAWLHHRFAQIHPFVDGNGRVARSLATLVLLRAGWMPFHVDRDERSAYIEALEEADAGHIVPLVGMVATCQHHWLERALIAAEGLTLTA